MSATVPRIVVIDRTRAGRAWRALKAFASLALVLTLAVHVDDEVRRVLG